MFVSLFVHLFLDLFVCMCVDGFSAITRIYSQQVKLVAKELDSIFWYVILRLKAARRGKQKAVYSINYEAHCRC